MTHEYTPAADAVIEAEREHILKDYGDAQQKEDFYGLAFSGGGIRSASFCLGIMQALVGGGVLKRIDYLSTASGGGYIGSALTWFLKRGLPDGTPAGTDPDNFPMGHARKGARNQQRNPNAVLDFLRQHGEYLTPHNNLDLTSFFAYSARTILVSFLFYFAVITFVLGILKIPGFLFRPPLPADAALGWLPNWYFLGVIVLAGFFVAVSILYSLLTRAPLGNTAWRYRFRVYSQVSLGLLVNWAIVLAVLGSLPVVDKLLQDLHAHIETAGATTILGTLMGWFQYYRQQKSVKQSQPKGSSTTSVIASALIIYGLLLSAFILTEHLRALPDSARLAWAIAIVAVIVLLGFFVNINYGGLHRMYRDRLMEAFLPNLENVAVNEWGLSDSADKALIETMCQAPNRRPYHLINANLVLADSETAKYRGRGGDCFILSPLYCGSDATGWRRSSGYMKGGGRGVTLSSAMAISGAAINPNAGNNSRGVTRNRWVSILYTLLNLRLGYWAMNPRFDDKPLLNRLFACLFPPNFIMPGLTSVIFKNLKEDKCVLELSDGGHFENLAVYELIRRKLKVIIACDGGADGAFAFDDLGNAIEKARVDFGAQIVFDDPDLDLRYVLPRSGNDTALAEKYQTAKRGFAVATIHYADGSEGRFIYIKSTMTEGLSTDIYSYKSANPEFPHQPTVDQFFDEVQIEAYRELGYYLGWQMLEANADAAPGERVDPSKPGKWI